MNFGLAFDNFDELPETLSGAGTLHDTGLPKTLKMVHSASLLGAQH